MLKNFPCPVTDPAFCIVTQQSRFHGNKPLGFLRFPLTTHGLTFQGLCAESKRSLCFCQNLQQFKKWLWEGQTSDLARCPAIPLSLAHGLEALEQALVLGTWVWTSSVGGGSYPGHWEGEQLGIGPKSSRLAMGVCVTDNLIGEECSVCKSTKLFSVHCARRCGTSESVYPAQMSCIWQCLQMCICVCLDHRCVGERSI